MKNIFNKAAALGLCFSMAMAMPAFSSSASPYAPATADSAHNENAITTFHRGCHPERADIVIDAATGQTLTAYKADELRYPASMTKIMTLMLVFDAIEDGRLNLDQSLPVSRHAASMVPVKLGLPAGSRIKLRDALSITAVRSSNDLAVVLAEAVAGSEQNFAQLMTEKARSLGLAHTVYKNASGLPDTGQVTTASETARLSAHLIANYPNYYPYFSKRHYSYQGRTFYNTNRLLVSYRGMDGIKTGYTCASGFNLAASAVRNNQRVIAVTFGHRSGAARNAHMRRLLDTGFEILQKRPLQMAQNQHAQTINSPEKTRNHSYRPLDFSR